MVLPVPWCWANLSHNHLSALPLYLCHLCSNWLPAPPANPQCMHQRRGRCPGRDSPDASGEADTERELWSSQQRCQEEWGRGTVWWSSGGSEVPGSNFSHLPPVAAVLVQVSLCWLMFQWLSSGSIVLCPDCGPGFGVTGTGSLLHLWLSSSPGTSVPLAWLVWRALDGAGIWDQQVLSVMDWL